MQAKAPKVRLSFLLVLACIGCLATATWYGVAYWKWIHRPLIEPAMAWDFSSSVQLAPLLKQHLLTDDFTIIRKVRQVPNPVLNSFFREKGNGRLLIVDPGKHFNSTDYIVDDSLPSRRLIFAGVSAQTVFVHFEQGGFGSSEYLQIFNTTSPQLQPRWQGRCERAATNLTELRSEILRGECY